MKNTNLVEQLQRTVKRLNEGIASRSYNEKHTILANVKLELNQMLEQLKYDCGETQ